MTDSSKSSFSTKPALGPTWAHVPNTRLFIQRSPISQVDGTERIATVIKSSRQVLPVIVFTLNKSDHVKKTYAKWHLGDELYRFENHTPCTYNNDNDYKEKYFIILYHYGSHQGHSQNGT